MVDIVEWLRNAASEHNMYRCDEAADYIERLREALKECSANFVTKSSDHRIAAQEILNEFERRALVARAALKEEQ